MPPAPPLSDQQLAFMRVLWDLGEASAAQVHEALGGQGRAFAPTTVATVLGRLEKRGLVTHRTAGRQYVFRACVDESEVRRTMLARLTDYFFAGDPAALVSHLAGGQRPGRDDLEEVRRLIAERESGGHDDG